MIADVETMTEEEILETGIRVLHEQLGTVGMLRFMQQVHPGTGDYTKERQNQPEKSLDEIMAEIEELRAKGLIPSCNERKDA